MFQKEKTKGITLISLMITVIILLILSSVAMNLAVNTDGVFDRTGASANKWNASVATEENAMQNIIEQSEEMGNVEQVASLITFTVNGTEYQAEEGMTWRIWITECKSDEFYISNSFAAKYGSGDYISTIDGANWRKWSCWA